LKDEDYRHQCLVRWLLKMRAENRQRAFEWLKGYTDSKGQWVRGWNQLHPESTLEADAKDQWAKGNRGDKDDWR
jgi:hypothetical protein